MKGWRSGQNRKEVVVRLTVKGRSIKTPHGIRRHSWHLDKCSACNGGGRQKLTKAQAIEWGYDSVTCPECDGRGYHKSMTMFDKPGKVEEVSFKDVPEWK